MNLLRRLAAAVAIFAGVLIQAGPPPAPPLPAGVNVLGKPSLAAYAANGSGVTGERMAVDGLPFAEALAVDVPVKPEKVHQVNISAGNALPVAKGDILFMRWSGRSLNEGGTAGEGQLFVQSSKDWGRALANQPFTLSAGWQTWNVFFPAPDDYAPGTLFFNIFLGQQAQKVAFGGIEVVNCGQKTPIDELRKTIRPTALASDFEAAFRTLAVTSAKSRIVGEMPSEWEDDSAWADVDVTYARLTDHPFKGEAAMRVTVSDIRSGMVLFRIPGVPLAPPYFAKVALAVRSSGGMPVKFGIRKIGAPYSYYSQREVGAGPEWTRYELLVPPVASDPNACLMVEMGIPGVLEVDGAAIEYLTPDEVAGGLDFSGNLLRVSSFPDGIAPPWNPHHESYKPENYAADAEVLGPTGQPALRIQTVPYGNNAGIAGVTTPFFGMGGKDYTFSVWMRAETSGHMVNLRMGPPSQQLWVDPYQKTVALGKTWKRFRHTVKLPYAPDGFYIAQVMNWGPAGTLWLDGAQVEEGIDATDFRRTGQVEAVIQPEVAYGLVEEGQPFRLHATVYDQIADGMVLKSELFDAFGKAYPMPDLPLTPGPGFRTEFTLPEAGQPRLGSYRLEYRVVDKDGQDAAKIGEVLLHRIRPAKFADQLRPNSPFGVHLTSNQEMPGVMRRLGFTWARLFGTHWQSVEKAPGRWDFTGMDKYIAPLHGANLCLLGILEGVPEWQRSWTAPTPPPKGYNNWHAKNVVPKDMDAFGEYARRISAQYRGKVQAWETWNEPFLPGFLNQGFVDGKYLHAPPETFLAMHQAAAAGLREGNPDAQVVFNGGAHYHAPSDAWTKRLFELGIFGTLDAVSYHSYLPSGIGFPGDRIYEATAAHVNPDHPAMPIWNTEGGPGPSDIRNFYRHSAPLGKTDKEAHWGDYLVRYWVSTLASGADKFFYYLYYGWGEYVSSYSLMNIDGRLAPNATAFSNLAWHLEGRTYARTVELKPDLLAYLFDGEGGTVAVILSKGIARGELAAIPAGVAVRDLFGNDLAAPVRLGDLAVFAEGPGMAPDALAAALTGIPGSTTPEAAPEAKPKHKGFWRWLFGGE
jgi:hypothetical protein